MNTGEKSKESCKQTDKKKSKKWIAEQFEFVWPEHTIVCPKYTKNNNIK